MKFLKSSLQRCRVLPKTCNKISFSRSTTTRMTKPKPFALSQSNYSKKVKSKKHKMFKAKKMPDMRIPFYVFKNDKELTTFKEFEITETRMGSLERTSTNHMSSSNLLSAPILETRCRTPQNYTSS